MEEERAAQSVNRVFFVAQPGARACTVPKFVCLNLVFLLLVRYAFVLRRSPSSSAFLRPIAIRHRSIAKRRATATIAFLRAAALLLVSSRSTGPHRRNATYCGWKRTIRHASSTIIRRNRGLPCLVMGPKRRLSPLVLSLGQSPK